jgi:transcriptional regulator with XRE-family HTH domain
MAAIKRRARRGLNPATTKVIAKNIRDYRIKNNVSQIELSVAAGVTPLAVYQFEKGIVRNPSLSTILAFSKATGLPVNKLIGLAA